MNDLISRQAAIDAMRELPYGYRGIVWDILNSLPSTKQPQICEFWDDESNFCTLHRPSVQPEQKRGKWVKYKNWYACSECGKEMFFAGTYDESQHYCYNCGARMGGDTE